MLMKVELVLILVVVSFLVGCASGGGSLPKQIPDALNAACNLYSKAKPEIIKARAYAVAHWNDKVPGTDQDLIPAEVKKTLQDLDTYLPELDKAGLALCSAAEGVNAFEALGADGKKVDWNQVLTVVLKGASIAIDLKTKGAF
jgi:hypothetical protein